MVGKPEGVTKPRSWQPLLSKRRQWFDEEGQEEQVEEPVQDTPEPEVPALIDLNAVDDKGNRLYFERNYVVQLRQESETRKGEIARLKAELEKKVQTQTQPQPEPESKQEVVSQSNDKVSVLEQQLNALMAQLQQNTLNTIAVKHGIPADLVQFIQGSTEAEWETNAALLAQHLKKSGTGGGSTGTALGATPATQPAVRTDAQRREEYFKGRNESPGIFSFDSKNLRFNGDK